MIHQTGSLSAQTLVPPQSDLNPMLTTLPNSPIEAKPPLSHALSISGGNVCEPQNDGNLVLSGGLAASILPKNGMCGE